MMLKRPAGVCLLIMLLDGAGRHCVSTRVHGRDAMAVVVDVRTASLTLAGFRLLAWMLQVEVGDHGAWRRSHPSRLGQRGG